MLCEKLKTLGITEALEKLGYNYDTIFGQLSPEVEQVYASYSWEKVMCYVDGIRLNYVIHAVPPRELMGENPWEEWFFQFDVPQHHVLFTEKQSFCTEEILIPEDDQEHPERVRGIYWYYECDEKSTPYLAQKECGK